VAASLHIRTTLDITATTTAEAVAAAAADDPHANCNTIEAEEKKNTHLDLRATKLVKLHF